MYSFESPPKQATRKVHPHPPALNIGGTGTTFDHEVARLVEEAGVPIIVAGGLRADNVAACVSETGGFGVDVSSGVERLKGKKDAGEVVRFTREARKAQEAL